MSPALDNILGLRFGRLTVTGRSGVRAKGGSIVWECVCDCGNTKVTNQRHLRHGYVKSCGCLLLEGSNYSDGRPKDSKVTKRFMKVLFERIDANFSSLNQAAKYLGVDGSLLTVYRQGRRGVSLVTAVKLANALNFDLGDIQGGKK